MPNDRDNAVDQLLAQSVNKNVKISTDKLAMFCQGSLEENRKRLNEFEAELATKKNDIVKYPDRSTQRKQMIAAHKQSVEQFRADNDPIYAIYSSLFQVSSIWGKLPDSEKMNSQQAVNQAFDNSGLSIDKKLEILSFAREFAEKVAYPNNLELTGKAKAKQVEAMHTFNLRYGIEKIKENPQDPTRNEMKGDIYESSFTNLNNNLMLMFATPYETTRNQTLIQRNAAKDIMTFCNQKIKEYHLMMLTGDMKKEFTDHTDPYLNGSEFRDTRKKYDAIMATKSITGSEQEKNLSGAKLFGRGSRQFDDMKDAYQDLRKATMAYTKNPTNANLKKLSEQSNITRKRANDYLKMKNEQIMRMDIPGHVERSPDGKSPLFIADNPNTRKRMDYANSLLGELKKLDAFIAKKQPKTLGSQVKNAAKPSGPSGPFK